MARVVLFHFHLFKNAGTSVDKILEMNFNNKFIKKEFPFYPYKSNISQVTEWIKKEIDKVAFSSHTARIFDFFRFEKETDIKVIPIIFIRHPFIRIHSAYHFEREKQKNIEALGPVIAKNTDLKGYIEIRWFIPNDNQTKNFHIIRIADLFFEEEGSIIEKAMKAIGSLPFVGLVEKFDNSIKKLETLVRQYFADFKTEFFEENVQFGLQFSLKDRLELIKKEVGETFFKKFYEMNKDDIMLWEKVKKIYCEKTI